MEGSEDFVQIPRKQEDSFTRWHLSPMILRRNLRAGGWGSHRSMQQSVIPEQEGMWFLKGEATQLVSG